MEKGRFGFQLWLYALLAFAAVLLDNPLWVLLIAGAAIALEKDEWLTRQCLEATALSLIYRVLAGAVQLPFTLLMEINFRSSVALSLVTGFNRAFTSYLLPLLLLVLVVLAVIRVIAGKDAKVPLISLLVDKAYGVVKKAKPQPAPAAPRPQPQAQAVPPMAEGILCAACGATMPYGAAFCTRCGASMK